MVKPNRQVLEYRSLQSVSNEKKMMAFIDYIDLDFAAIATRHEHLYSAHQTVVLHH
jgi:hypothetical protein